MSINPASDIVLDVIKAAEPAASRKAVEKLASLAGARGASAADAFEHTLRRSALNFSARLHLGAAAPAKFVHNFQTPDARANAYKGLEQLVLKNLVEDLLPSGPSGLFGSGIAGDVWRSMLADQLAAGLAKAVGLGIAERPPNRQEIEDLASASLSASARAKSGITT